MPSKSCKQHRLMAMVANDPKAAKRIGIPQRVGQEYMAADKGKKFAYGGDVESDVEDAMRRMPRGRKQMFSADDEDRYNVERLNSRDRGSRSDDAPSRTQIMAMGGGDKDVIAGFGRARYRLPIDERDRESLSVGPDVMFAKPSGGRPQIKGGLGVQYEKRYAQGGGIRADGIAKRGRTRGRIV